MISIYAVILKASMAFIQASCIGQIQWGWFSASPRSLHDLVLFHDAGQGPWGSVSWLRTHHWRQPVAALASCIIVAAVAVDSFVQQLIQPMDCVQKLPGRQAASVPAANVVTYGGFPDALQPYFMAGLYTRQNLTDFECMTGNCTFAGNYTALGFCSSCEDVSTKVTITKSCSMISGPDKDPKKYPWPCDGRVMSAHSKGHMEIVPPAVWNITTAYPPFNMTFYHNWLNSTIFEIWADEDIPYEDDTPDVFKSRRVDAM